MRWANAFMSRRAGRSTGSMMGMNLLALTTVGARSGQPRRTPLAWVPGPDGSRYIAASANGAISNPAWYYNLAAHPELVMIEVGGETIPVTAEELHGEEREAAWHSIVSSVPRFGAYRTKTDRVIPIIRLTPRG